ncbi:hypothetical protein, partial [Methanobrevibacter sp. UBA212]|uniref:hypothetical protein n=1 Tax=Methanobrevibacter sp. UBA212 TaxID=1915476 RepID=UPI0025F0B6A3
MSNDLLVQKVNDFLTSMQSTLYPLGLHALGEPWSEADIASTVSAMLSQDHVLENNQGTLNLFTELANCYYSKGYNQLSALEREV